jgi:hypothetical protein
VIDNNPRLKGRITGNGALDLEQDVKPPAPRRPLMAFIPLTSFSTSWLAKSSRRSSWTARTYLDFNYILATIITHLSWR